MPSFQDQINALQALGISSSSISDAEAPTAFGTLLGSYFEYRANSLNATVESLLMDAGTAKALFQEVRQKLGSRIKIPMNKQKGKKRKPAYLTGL
jgi:hypothetical protein